MRYSKVILSIAALGLQLFAPVAVKAGGRELLYLEPVRPSGLSYQGYLIVYSATDRFEDGEVPYNPHSSYSIYTIDGKLFKRVENHVSISDETPTLVALPAGTYKVDVRSEENGFVHLTVVVDAGRQTVLNLDGTQPDTQKRLARAKQSRSLAEE